MVVVGIGQSDPDLAGPFFSDRSPLCRQEFFPGPLWILDFGFNQDLPQLSVANFNRPLTTDKFNPPFVS